MKHELPWVDNVKGISMLAVYLIHSEVYYGIGDKDYGYLLIPFYVNAFFFVSGYLFWNKYLLNNSNAMLAGGGKNVIFKVVIPTVLFSSLFFIPKMMFHGNAVDWKEFGLWIIGGISFWFTSALAVAQIILLGLLWVIKSKKIWIYLIVTVGLFAIGLYLNNSRQSTAAEAFFPWFYMTGFEFTLVMTLGGLYRVYEKRIDSVMKYTLIVVIIAYVCLIISDWHSHELKLVNLGGIVDIRGGMCVLCGIILIIALSKILPSIGFLKFISRNSILFYFFSGLFPAAIGVIAKSACHDTNYGVTLIVAFSSVCCGALTTLFVVKYFPYLTDLRKLNARQSN